MRPMTAWFLGSLGVLWIGASTPSYAAVIRQNFELTVTDLGYRPGDDPSTAPLPPIGTRGTGSFTYDEADIHYIDEPHAYPIGYYLGYPREIGFRNFSIDFYGQHFTELNHLNSRIGDFFLFDKTPSGHYTPNDMVLETVNGYKSFIYTSRYSLGADGHGFGYTPIPTVHSGLGSANGILRFTDAEPIPDPPASALSTVFALGLGWFYHRRRTARKSL